MSNRMKDSQRRSVFLVCTLLAALAGAPAVAAQDQQADPSAQERLAPPPGTYLTPAPGRMQRTMTWIGTKIEGPDSRHDGFYPQMGGMITGSGLSLGPGFRQRMFGDRAVLDVSAALSWKRYRAINAQMTWPRLMGERLSLGAQAAYHDFTRVNYFGIGNASNEDDRTDYRIQNVDALGFATVHATSWLSVTGRAGMLRRLEIEPGTSSLYPSIGERFDDLTAPGLDRQPTFIHADVSIDADTRDVPGYPSRGGRYRLMTAAFHDRSFGEYSFRRVEADAAQYIPIGRSVLAFRGRLDVSQDGGREIPFYLLPSLGGANSLRGYADYRFRDRDLLMVNAEYRWPIARFVDLAGFYDAGAVGARVRSLTGEMHTDYGLGIRVHSTTHSLVRLDVARSVEGTRVMLNFSAPLGLPNKSIAPYVP